MGKTNRSFFRLFVHHCILISTHVTLALPTLAGPVIIAEHPILVRFLPTFFCLACIRLVIIALALLAAVARPAPADAAVNLLPLGCNPIFAAVSVIVFVFAGAIADRVYGDSDLLGIFLFSASHFERHLSFSLRFIADFFFDVDCCSKLYSRINCNTLARV